MIKRSPEFLVQSLNFKAKIIEPFLAVRITIAAAMTEIVGNTSVLTTSSVFPGGYFTFFIARTIRASAR